MTGQDAEFRFSHIQPTALFRGHDTSAGGRRCRFRDWTQIQRRGALGSAQSGSGSALPCRVLHPQRLADVSRDEPGVAVDRNDADGPGEGTGHAPADSVEATRAFWASPASRAADHAEKAPSESTESPRGRSGADGRGHGRQERGASLVSRRPSAAGGCRRVARTWRCLLVAQRAGAQF
jgi:hypothetical protein